MNKKNKKALLIALPIVSLVAASTTSAFVLTNRPKQEIQNQIQDQRQSVNLKNIKYQDSVSQNIAGGILDNPKVYFKLDEILPLEIENGQWKNIVENLNLIPNTSPAKNQLLEIMKNLEYYRLWESFKRGSQELDLIEDFRKKFALDFNFESVEQITGGNENIKKIINELNGFVEGTRVNITGIGNTSASANSPDFIPGAKIVDLSLSVASSTTNVNLNDRYNTLVKIAEIDTSLNSDVVFNFEYSGTSVVGTKNGKLIIKNENGELQSANFSLENYSKNLNLFGRWEGFTGTQDSNQGFPTTIRNFIIVRTLESLEVYVRAEQNERIQNIQVESGKTAVKKFGILNSQLSSQPIISSQSFSSIRFYGVGINTQNWTNREGFDVYLGDKTTFENPIYAKSSNQDYSVGNLVQIKDENGDVNLKLSYDKSSEDREKRFEISPNLAKLPIQSEDLNKVNLSVSPSSFDNGNYAKFSVGFNKDIISFNSAQANNSSTYNPLISLDAKDYAKKIFFEPPSISTSLDFSAQEKNIQGEIFVDNEIQARKELARIYNKWAIDSTQNYDSNKYSKIDFSYNKITSEQSNGRFIKIKQNQVTKFSNFGPELYKQLSKDYVEYANIIKQLDPQADVSNLSPFILSVLNEETASDVIRSQFFSKISSTNLQPIINRIVEALNDRTKNSQTKDAIYEKEMANIIELVYRWINSEFKKNLDDIFLRSLRGFIESSNKNQALSFNKVLNLDVVKTNEHQVNVNGTTQKVKLFSLVPQVQSWISKPDGSAASASDILKSIIDFIYKDELGTSFFAFSNSIATYRSFLQQENESQDDLNIRRSQLYSSEYLKDRTRAIEAANLYIELFKLVGIDWNAKMFGFLESGQTINFGTLKSSQTNDPTFSIEGFIEEFASKLENTSRDNSNLIDTKERENEVSIKIYDKKITSEYLKVLLSGSNIYNSLNARLNSISNLANTDDEKRVINLRLRESIPTLNVVANYALVAGNVNVKNYIDNFVNEQSQLSQAQKIINEIDLSKQLVFRTVDVQSFLSAGTQAVDQIFKYSMLIFSLIFMVIPAFLLVTKRKTINFKTQPFLKSILTGLSVLGAVVLAVALWLILI
ncbi:hypothetical protein [Mycoplasmopsis pulmonis]|uniref:hypothetical protein n=1 Tax=Mycoplasmopsis pulmonis TaxID=2107 RepID=UPI0010050D52|nr:hypothetical protein [Mycoplasmopsis pulmonis]MDZ7293196.1 hypothetical protein [Mycoplasmopsis pulmonis]VEU67994.1 Uncharacterised protein [Mycoplasmopsis pulmonis]